MMFCGGVCVGMWCLLGRGRCGSQILEALLRFCLGVLYGTFRCFLGTVYARYLF